MHVPRAEYSLPVVRSARRVSQRRTRVSFIGWSEGCDESAMAPSPHNKSGTFERFHALLLHVVDGQERRGRKGGIHSKFKLSGSRSAPWLPALQIRASGCPILKLGT